MNAVPRVVRQLRDEPRAFTDAEKSLIRKVHGYMPAQQLLELLNERLVAHWGKDETRHTMEQLFAEIGEADAAPAGGHDWSSLRKVLAKAKRAGVLDAVNREVIDDFAIVFSLTTGQVLRLQDVLLRSREESNE